MSYITVADITDGIAETFDLTNYIEESDSAINDLAERLGVRDPDNIDTDPLHWKLRRYAVTYVLRRLCQDKIGTGNLEVPEFNKYLVGYNLYKAEFAKIESEISIEMIAGTVNEIRDRANLRTAAIVRN